MSTVSITASPTTSRRRPTLITDRKSGLDLIETQTQTLIPQNSEILRDLSNSILERPTRDLIQPRRTLNPTPPKKTSRKSVNKPEKTRFEYLSSLILKYLVFFLLAAGCVQLYRRYKYPPRVVIDSSDFDGRLAELESSYKKTTKMTQVMIESVDRKFGEEVSKVKSEIEKIDGISKEVASLDRRMGGFEKWVGEFSENERLMKEDFEKFKEEYRKEKGLASGEDVSLDEIRVFAGNVVRKEIEKHAADGLGRVDYALGSGGAVVLSHSEPYGVGKGGGWVFGGKRNGAHKDAEKMLKPSFGEPGQCFPLKGSSGFVDIKLRTAIVPEAVTLEHVAKSVAYDRSSAPKDCKVSGWLRGQDAADVALDSEKMITLTEFTYDLEKSNAQTFNVLEDSAGSTSNIDTIRLAFSSNHGSLSHTCIYRVRVHGREPDSLSTLPM